MTTLRDLWRLAAAFYRAEWVLLGKSPINLWTAFLVQTAYYAAQVTFWVGVRHVAPGQGFADPRALHGFLVTLAVVDNLYLATLGRGSVEMMARASEQSLEPILVWPRSTLGVLCFLRPSLDCLPGLALALGALGWYWAAYDVGAATATLHAAAMLVGVLVLNGISFLYRVTVFWTEAIVRVRHGNPSFKIMVRPLAAFPPAVRLVLFTVLPALFITGVPAELVTGARGPAWLAASLAACAALWLAVGTAWRAGLRRYAARET